jgi:bacterioferritin
MSKPFEIDLDEIRHRAREHLRQGAVTAANTADRKRVIAVLNEALATEIVCALRYQNHYFLVRGIQGQTVAEQFLEHVGEEQQHAAWLAERIVQLGGVPNFDPSGLAARSHTQYCEGNNLKQMIIDDLVGERIAVETYTQMARWLGDDDPTSRRVIEKILAKEEEHAGDLAQLLEGL